jgi:histidyl-tRNA synthetase
MIQRVKGTQDWLSLDLFNRFIQIVQQHLTLYQYHEIKTPVLEPTELFHRTLGVTTDVVSKEMFILKTVHEDDALCLRPEATASTVRAFIEHGISELPWQVFSYGPMFRYERPQKGRFREFHQVTIENIGVASISNDVELITMLDRLFHTTLKLENYALTINFLGSYADREKYRDKLKAFLDSPAAADICETCTARKTANIMRVFDCKNPTCQTIYTLAPYIVDHLSAESKVEWQRLQEQLALLSISFTVDKRLVRGLDYYNKTVFEFVSEDLGAQKTFCGGGRYDGLVKLIDGKQEQPAVGAAIGIERILLLLEQSQTVMLPQKKALTVIIPVAEEQKNVALLLADELRSHERCVQTLLDNASVKSMLRKANKLGATYAVLIGEDEQQKHEVTLKHMVTGTEQRVKQHELHTIV